MALLRLQLNVGEESRRKKYEKETARAIAIKWDENITRLPLFSVIAIWLKCIHPPSLCLYPPFKKRGSWATLSLILLLQSNFLSSTDTRCSFNVDVTRPWNQSTIMQLWRWVFNKVSWRSHKKNEKEASLHGFNGHFSSFSWSMIAIHRCYSGEYRLKPLQTQTKPFNGLFFLVFTTKRVLNCISSIIHIFI